VPFGIIWRYVIKLSSPDESARLGSNADEEWNTTSNASSHRVAGFVIGGGNPNFVFSLVH
jgi:hypothetical protein